MAGATMRAKGKLKPIHLVNDDCLVAMKKLQAGSVDLILTDLPYGTTACAWDSLIDLNKLWTETNRLTNLFISTARQPFTAVLICSNIKNYRYNWVWQKSRPARYVQAKKMPLSYYEDICVFYKKLPTYNPQFTEGKAYKKQHVNTSKPNYHGEEKRNGTVTINDGKRYPSDILVIPNSNKGSIHSTQKPIVLFEYLIKTYSNEGDTVLDCCMGSGTTGVACKNLNRRFIGIEKDPDIFQTAKERINATPSR
jgi:site-specific DNA-methyltransferase (adenine-specific)